jgi:23S rRNA (adenine2030-N6)-methyltransferase
VFKHAGLLAVADALASPLSILDTHAGAGAYTLGPTGEWTAGIGRVWACADAGDADPALARYLAALRAAGATPPAASGPSRASYPGSPRLLLDAAGATGRWVGHEIDAGARSQLIAALGGDARTTVHATSAWDAVPDPTHTLIVVDPPYVTRQDWTDGADLIARLRAVAPEATAVLWYPIKSWSRPNLLLNRLRERAQPFIAVDLIVTPLELQRPQLAGSGLAVIGGPPCVGPRLASLATALLALLTTHGGRGSVRVTREPSP